MEFIRRKSTKTYKLWRSDCKNYRITWKTQVCGISVPAECYACVLVFATPRSTEKIWTFVGRRGPYRKVSAAVKACERHRKVWESAIKLAKGDRKGRADRLRALDMRATEGSGPHAGRLMRDLPVWAEGLVDILFPRGDK